MSEDRAVALSHGGPLVRVHFGVGEHHRDSYEAMEKPWPGPIPMIALVDTGADLCIVKEGTLARLGVTATTRRIVTSMGRPPVTRFSYLGEFTFDSGVGVPGSVIEDLPTDARMDCILGREVLRYCRLVYDGQQGVVELTMLGRPVRVVSRPEEFT